MIKNECKQFLQNCSTSDQMGLTGDFYQFTDSIFGLPVGFEKFSIDFVKMFKQDIFKYKNYEKDISTNNCSHNYLYCYLYFNTRKPIAKEYFD